MNNDLEDITAAFGIQLFKSKVNVNVTGGVQRNNLGNDLLTTTARFIGNATLGWSITQNLNVGLNYGNFTTNTN